jgi:hypothetical protein
VPPLGCGADSGAGFQTGYCQSICSSSLLDFPRRKSSAMPPRRAPVPGIGAPGAAAGLVPAPAPELPALPVGFGGLQLEPDAPPHHCGAAGRARTTTIAAQAAETIHGFTDTPLRNRAPGRLVPVRR